MSLAHEASPAFKPPPLACDAHFHVFGPEGAYPYEANLRYKPPHAPLTEYLELAKLLGFERFVFVQPSAYGRDNTCMLDAMREIGPARCRGIVDVHEDIADAELDKLHALGVRGVRINVSPIHPRDGAHRSGKTRVSGSVQKKLGKRGTIQNFRHTGEGRYPRPLHNQ